MTIALPLILGAVLGYTIRRWWALVLAPVAGAAVLGVALLSSQSLADTPAIFVAILAAVGVALGTAIGQARLSRSAASSRFPRL